jgi:hypothetical protein
MKELISLTEAAQILGKSRQWIWILSKTHELHAKKVGGVYIFDKEEVLQFREKLMFALKSKETL